MSELSTEQETLLNKLSVGSYAFVDLTPTERILLAQTLRPSSGGFSQLQQDLLANWYLSVTPEQVSAINTLLPEGHKVEPLATESGLLVINADLLTDCVRPKDTYHNAFTVLVLLPFVQLLPEQFPVPEVSIP